MQRLTEFYQKIDKLRSKGIKMKEIADWIDMSPSVLSSLYTTVIPHYIETSQKYPPEEALDKALALVNNISKKRLLTHLQNHLDRLDEMAIPQVSIAEGNQFMRQLSEEIQSAGSRGAAIQGIYMGYSLSSSSDRLKLEPYLIASNDLQLQIGRISAYGDIQWGIGLMPDSQNLLGMLNENQALPFTPVTIYLQIPFFRHPEQLRGLYIGLDYNRNPIARRLLLVKLSDSTSIDEFLTYQGSLIAKEELTPEQQNYYDYTCQVGDYIKMCTIPSLRMDDSDLIKEKKMLSL